MRYALIIAVVFGCLIGSVCSYVAFRPFVQTITTGASPLSSERISLVQVRGVILGVDSAAREITIRVSYPAFPEQAAPFRISFDSIQNFINFDQGNITSGSGAQYAHTATVGESVTMNMARRPGRFLVLSLIARTPGESDI